MVSTKTVQRIATDLSWLHHCTCSAADPHAFFLRAGEVIDPVALNISRACPSRKEEVIFAYARNIKKGFYGGLSAGQRSKLTLDEALEYVANDPPQWDLVPEKVRHTIQSRTNTVKISTRRP